MRKIIFYTVTITIGIICFFLSTYVIPLFINGITVKYQRVTGPEFVVLEGKENLKISKNTPLKNINYDELFVANDLDNNYGYPRESKYRIYGKCVGTRSIMKGGEIYPVMDIKKMISVKGYNFLKITLVMLFTTLLALILTKFFN